VTITLVFNLLVREAVACSIELARPFEAAEMLQPLWDAGYEVSPEDAPLHLALYREAKGKQPRLWMADSYPPAEKALCGGTAASQRYYHLECVPVGLLCQAVFTEALSKEIKCKQCYRSIHLHKRSIG
jgi:hypothetical protein